MLRCVILCKSNMWTPRCYIVRTLEWTSRCCGLKECALEKSKTAD